MTPDIVIFADPGDRLAGGLGRAIAGRGGRAAVVPLNHCRTGSGGRCPIEIPGFGERLPAGAFVRTVQGGSFEQVTARLGILHMLRDLGVLVWNDARAVEACVDKSMTSMRLAAAGVPTPRTWSMEHAGAARALATARCAGGNRLVLKPLFGSQGRGLRLIAGPDDVPAPEDVNGVYHLQEFVATPDGSWHDHRVMVSAGRAVAGMTRHGAGWITNMKQGADALPLKMSPAMADLAVAAAAAVGADFAGVDIIAGSDGRLQVLEVNSMPSWSGLQKVTPVRLSARLAADFMAALRHRREPAGERSHAS